MTLFCGAINSDSVSRFRYPLRLHTHVDLFDVLSIYSESFINCFPSIFFTYSTLISTVFRTHPGALVIMSTTVRIMFRIFFSSAETCCCFWNVFFTLLFYFFLLPIWLTQPHILIDTLSFSKGVRISEANHYDYCSEQNIKKIYSKVEKRYIFSSL